MFWLLRTMFSILILIAITGAIVYFLPHNVKLNALAAISNVAPESLQENAESLLLTPSESREKILTKLEMNIEGLRNASEDEAETLLQESETLLQELKEKNDELSLGELAKQKIVSLLVKEPIECK